MNFFPSLLLSREKCVFLANLIYPLYCHPSSAILPHTPFPVLLRLHKHGRRNNRSSLVNACSVGETCDSDAAHTPLKLSPPRMAGIRPKHQKGYQQKDTVERRATRKPQILLAFSYKKDEDRVQQPEDIRLGCHQRHLSCSCGTSTVASNSLGPLSKLGRQSHHRKYLYSLHLGEEKEFSSL